MKRLQLFISLTAALLVFHMSPVEAASLNDNAVLALDGNFASVGCQGLVSPNGIGPNSLVGFGIYVANFLELRAYSINLAWTGDAELVTVPQSGLVSGTSLPMTSATINGNAFNVATEFKLFDNELTIGEQVGTGLYRNHYALAGGTAPSSTQYRLIYAAIFKTSSSFNVTDKLEVNVTVTLGDDTAAEFTPANQVFCVNETTPSITFLQPAGNSIYEPGSICQISWECTVINSVNLSYSVSEGDWSVIADNLYGINSYYWRIPSDVRGDVSIRLTDSQSRQVTSSSEITVAAPKTHYTLDAGYTGSSDIVLFPAEIPPTVNGSPIQPGDEIAVFTPRGDCAGIGVWNNTNCSITIWGDDPQTDGIEGFVSGEPYLFKVWVDSTQTEYELTVTCSEGDCIFGVNNIAVVSSASHVSAAVTAITMSPGWNMISSDVMPSDPSISSIFSQTDGKVVIVKNGRGEVYWPAYNVNQIGNWNITDGYQVYMSRAGVLSITGVPVDTADVKYELSTGWNLVSYLGTDNTPPSIAYSSIMNRLVMLKNNAGQIYWPAFKIDQIRSMRRRSGYLLYVSAPVSFGVQRPAKKDGQTYFTPVQPSDNNATIMISAEIMPVVNNRMIKTGDEIGVFTSSGICIGAGVWNGENLAITIWGDDSQTDDQDGIKYGECFNFRIWDIESLSEVEANATYTAGSDEYSANAIVVLESLVGEGLQTRVEADVPGQFKLHKNRPNPFNPSTMIGFTIPASVHVELTIYNALGEKVDVLVDNILEAGTHEVVWHAGNYASGIYFYRLNADGFIGNGRMTLLK